MKTLDPKDFNLHPKTVLEDLGRKHLTLVMDRKSRIIMSDGRKIEEKAETLMKQGIKKVMIQMKTTVLQLKNQQLNLKMTSAQVAVKN